MRQSLAPLVRKTLSFAKERTHLQQQTTFFQAFYNMARPHMSLREPLVENAEPLVENAPRFQQRSKPKTPAVEAVITKHVWTFRELLTAKMDEAP